MTLAIAAVAEHSGIPAEWPDAHLVIDQDVCISGGDIMVLAETLAVVIDRSEWFAS